MASTSYYREQAQLFLRWANECRDESTAQRLMARARDMLELAEQAQDKSCIVAKSVDLFSSRQMGDKDKAQT
jgi:hypothetical protein